MTNLKDTESQVTLEDSRTLTGKKCGGWHGYQRRDEKIHRMTLSNTVVITGLHTNIFSMTQPLQKGFQVTSEGEILIIKISPSEVTWKPFCSGCVMLNIFACSPVITTVFDNVMRWIFSSRL